MRKLLILIAAMFFVACGDKNHAGGYGSETTNGVTLSGFTEPNATITFRPATALREDLPRSYRLSADSQGYWEYNLEPSGWLMQVESDSAGFVRNFVVKKSDSLLDLGVLSVEPLLNVQGTVVAEGPLEVVLYGIARKATVNANGQFTFTDLPQGRYVASIQRSGKEIAQSILIAQNGVNVELSLANGGLMLENFEAENQGSLLQNLFGSSFWLFWPDTFRGNIVIPMTEAWDTSVLLTDSLAYNGKSLHVIADVNEQDPMAEVGLLYVLGSRGLPGEIENVHDLSLSDKLRFMCKGTGRVVVRLWANLKTNPREQLYLEQEIELNADWSEVSLLWREFTLNGTPIGEQWADYEILKITWVIRQDSDFWLDNIQIPDLEPIDLLD